MSRPGDVVVRMTPTLVLGLFNSLPGAPLDGGRILRSFLWRRNGDRLRATVLAAQAGSVIAFLLVGVGVLEYFAGTSMGGLWLVFIGWFVLSAARAEQAEALLLTLPATSESLTQVCDPSNDPLLAQCSSVERSDEFVDGRACVGGHGQ